MAKTYFFWDDLEDNIVEEYDEAGNSIADYTTEPDQFGNVISQRRGGQSSFFHFDAVGSTLAVTDENQNITDTRAYSAFGETTESTGSINFPFQYLGQKGYYRDSVSGQYMARRRPYEPVRARWLACDPLALRVVVNNLYWYVRNRPTILIDPSGTIVIAIPIIVVAGVGITLGDVAIAVAAAFGVGILECLAIQQCRDAVIQALKDAVAGLSEQAVEVLRRHCRAQYVIYKSLESTCSGCLVARGSCPPDRLLRCIHSTANAACWNGVVASRLTYFLAGCDFVLNDSSQGHAQAIVQAAAAAARCELSVYRNCIEN